MNIDVARAGKPPRKLRQLLKSLSLDPDPETVHELRTQTRRLEAILHTLSPRNTASPSPGDIHRILKLLKPVRRAAGRVRDMDVLIGKASSLSSSELSGGVVRLIERMSEIRTADARRLHRRVKRRRKEARSSLKRFLRNLEHTKVQGHVGAATILAPPQILAQELDHWPRLTEENLHEFRKGVKELHYMLQLFPGQDGHRMTYYARVKDRVGDWHDWLELKSLAESVLDPKEDAPMLSEIRSILQEKLHAALNAANALRKRGIEMPHAA
jgi:CHAD domain-containing protein